MKSSFHGALRARSAALLITTMLATGLAAGVVTPAFAQDAAPQEAEASTGGNDIIVTARRREERLQDVPVSISAQTGEQLARQGVTTAMNLGKIAPSLTVTQSPRGSNTPYFVIRGQRLIDTSVVLDPVTVVYMNELALMRPQGLNGALFDVQSVQVLRGPQGTLFGRNTTGGAVLVTTNPATNQLEGKVALTLGNYNLRTFEGVINIPLGDRAAIRIGAVRSKRDGYLKNRVTGYDTNNEDYDAERVTFRWEPVDGVETVTYFNRLHSDDHGSAMQIYDTVLTNANRPQLLADIAKNKADHWRFDSDIAPFETAKTWDATNITTIDLGGDLTLKNIFGYRHIKTDSSYDLDGSSVYIQRQIGGRTDVRQISNELQVSGTSTSFDWLAGVFYFREKGSDVAFSTNASAPTTQVESGVDNVVNTSYSAFLSGTFRFSDALSLSAGGRITKDKREGDGLQRRTNLTNGTQTCGFSNNGVISSPPCLFAQSVSFTEPSWSVSLNYKLTPDVLLYAAHRHGYRSGGVQNRATTAAASVPFGPEKVNDVELGIKSSFELGNVKVRFNADVYQAWYKGLQRSISFLSPVTGSLVSGLINAADSKVRGAEVELNVTPVTGLDLSGSAGYVDGKYKNFVLRPTATTTFDISSQPFAYVPDWTINAGARYTLPLASSAGELSVSYNFRHQSGYVNSDTPQLNQNIPGYELSDVRMDWYHVMDSKISLAVWVNNVFDKYYIPYSTNLLGYPPTGTVSLGVAGVNPGARRQFGAQVRYEF